MPRWPFLVAMLFAPSSFLLPVVRPGALVASLLLVAMPLLLFLVFFSFGDPAVYAGVPV